jgi:MFS family permease
MTPAMETRPFYGWWLLFFLWVIYTLPIGFAFYSPVILAPFMIQDLGWSRGEIMVGVTAIMLLFGITSPLTAWMITRIGARKTIVIGGCIAASAAFLISRLGHIYPLFITLGVFLGLGISMSAMIPVQTVAIAWFHARRALALGLVLGGGAVGGFLAPQLINWVVLRAGGNWRVGFLLIAIASLAGSVVALLAVRNRPGDVGQHPDGVEPEARTDPAAGPKRTARTYRTSEDWTVREALKTRALWLLILAVTGTFYMWQIIVTQGPLHLQDRGFDPAMSAFLYSLAIGLSIAGRFTIAGLGDRIEPRYLFAFGSLCTLIGGILFWFVSPDKVWVAYLYPLLAGFGFGAAYVCIPTITGNYWGAEAFPGVTGLISPMAMLIQSSAAPLAGLLYDRQGTYLTIMIVSWLAVAVGFTAMLFCRPPERARVSKESAESSTG